VARKKSRLIEEMLETADGMLRIGVMDAETHAKLTAPYQESRSESAAPVSSEEIRSMREKSNLSQAAFARYLNLTPGYISQLERGVRQPKGPALALLNVLKRTGLEVLM
jgi:putative transcriptional regulator